MRSLKPLAGIAGIALVTACSSNGVSNKSCVTQGLYVDQISCSTSTGSTCSMSSLVTSSNSKALICWKPDGTGGLATTGGTTSGTTTGTTTGGLATTGGWIIASYTPIVIQPIVIQLPSEGLYGAVHSSSDCKAVGGSVVNPISGDKICSVPLDSCPAGWKPYGKDVRYTVTEKTQGEEKYNCGHGSRLVQTGFHSELGPIEIEYKKYCALSCMGKCLESKVLYARVIKSGCY